MASHITLSADWDASTIAEAVVEIEAHLDYEEQSGRLDDRTREGFVIALEVLSDVRDVLRKHEANEA